MGSIFCTFPTKDPQYATVQSGGHRTGRRNHTSSDFPRSFCRNLTPCHYKDTGFSDMILLRNLTFPLPVRRGNNWRSAICRLWGGVEQVAGLLSLYALRAVGTLRCLPVESAIGRRRMVLRSYRSCRSPVSRGKLSLDPGQNIRKAYNFVKPANS